MTTAHVRLQGSIYIYAEINSNRFSCSAVTGNSQSYFRIDNISTY